MKGSNLLNIFKSGDIVIPIYFLKNYKKMNLSLEEFVFLMYLYNSGNSFLFNPNKFSEDLNIELNDILNLVGELTNKGFIKVEVIKNDKGYMEELIILDGFYDKLSLIMANEVNEENEKSENNSIIFEYIEKEFGRTLGPTEVEIIKTWLENGMSEELIKEAVKEAVFNGVSKLRYIDKILYEWGKNGIKTVKDVEENRKKRNSQKEKEEKDSNIDYDTLEWNWFDDDE